MQISYNWLKDFVKLPDSTSAEEVAEKLKMSTVEVEGIRKIGAELEGVVVGKILKIEAHPNADKLKVCEVDLKDEKATIVCGGSNLTEGMLVAVAKIGAKVKWHGEGELVTLEKVAIRGVESSGMICGADEIGLLDFFPKSGEKEIVDLSPLLFSKEKKVIGQPLAKALGIGDEIFEIDNKSLSNRPDLWGHYGIAREVAVLNGRDVLPYKTTEIKPGKGLSLKVKIENSVAAPRYMAVAVKGVKIGESPAPVKQRLISCGLRPINSVVDITNYVMLETGQPLHAFDARELEQGGKYDIGVRYARSGEKIITLDEKERDLPEKTLLITSHDKPVAIAGIMGGLGSGVKDDTNVVVFEAANFEAGHIRRSEMRMGLRTDASSRFEKSLDPSLCETALKKAVSMLIENSPGAETASAVVDEGGTKTVLRPIEIEGGFIEKKLGVEIPTKTVKTILGRLGFEVKATKAQWEVVVPSWRAHDAATPEAIVEEVARIYGYENVPSGLPEFRIAPPIENRLRSVERKITDLLVEEQGFTEVYNYSFVSLDQIKKTGDDPAQYLELDNPLSKEKPYIRRDLLQNLLDNLVKNAGKRDRLKIFEIGQVYLPELPGLRSTPSSDELLPRQDTWLMAVYFDKKTSNAFSLARQALEGLTFRLPFKFKIEPAATVAPAEHPSRVAEVMLNEQPVGKLFELHPKAAKSFGLEGRVGILKINLSLVENNWSEDGKLYQPIAVYPETDRDLAFLIDKKITNQEISDALSAVDPMLKNVELFDVFEGEGVGEDKKSMAYHLTLASAERTLKTEEVDGVMGKVKSVLENKFKVEFR